MFFRSLGALIVAAAAFGLIGAGGSGSSLRAASGADSSYQTIARLHWLGKKAVLENTNAGTLNTLWRKHATVVVENQTLDRLASWPWRPKGERVQSSHPNGLLVRPILDDLLNQESCVELRAAPNAALQLVLAAKISPERFALWRSNLTQVLGTPAGGAAGPGGATWTLTQGVFRRAQVARAGDWGLVGLGPEKNDFFQEVVSRTQGGAAPIPDPGPGQWLGGQMDLPRLFELLKIPSRLPAAFKRLDFGMQGEGQNVRVRGRVLADRALPIRFEPWTLPTNVIREPLISFTAMQGASVFLPQIKPLSELKIAWPNQVYVWSQVGIPFQHYFAARVEQSTNYVAKLAGPLMEFAAKHGPPDSGGIHIPNPISLVWTGLMAYAPPGLAAVKDSGHEYIAGGLSPIANAGARAPQDLYSRLQGRTNLVFYDWEITTEQLNHWRFLDDTRHVFFSPEKRPVLTSDLAAVRWFETSLTNLANTVTEVTLTAPNELSFVRKSGLGLTGFELVVLGNWLESPDFPRWSRPPDRPKKADKK